MPAKRIKEKTVKEHVKEMLEAAGVWYCMPATGGYGKSGNFDFIICVDGAFLGVETKRDDKEMPMQLQTDNANNAYASGATVLLIHKDNLHLLARALRELRARMAELPQRINHTLNDWPMKPAAPAVDDGAKLIKRKTK